MDFQIFIIFVISCVLGQDFVYYFDYSQPEYYGSFGNYWVLEKDYVIPDDRCTCVVDDSSSVGWSSLSDTYFYLNLRAVDCLDTYYGSDFPGDCDDQSKHIWACCSELEMDRTKMTMTHGFVLFTAAFSRGTSGAVFSIQFQEPVAGDGSEKEEISINMLSSDTTSKTIDFTYNTGDGVTRNGGSWSIGDNDDDFHEYGMLFSAVEISFFFDGKKRFTINRDPLPTMIEYTVDFDVDFLNNSYTGYYYGSSLGFGDIEMKLLKFEYWEGATEYPYGDTSIAHPDETTQQMDDSSIDTTGDSNGDDDTQGETIWYLRLYSGLPLYAFIAIGVILVIVCVLVCTFLVCCFATVICVVKKKKRGGGPRETFSLDELEKLDKKESVESEAMLNIDKDLFKIKADELQISKSVGKGGYCTVYQAEWNNIKVAFKCFSTKDLLGTESFGLFEKELTLMSSISFPYIVTFYGAVLKPPRCGVVMELCMNGNVKSYLQKNKVDRKIKFRFLKEMSLALNYLAGKSIIHRDFKPENVLVSDQITMKICDFGVSRVFTEQSATLTKRVGTRFDLFQSLNIVSIYMAPELSLGKEYDHQVDVFSFAICAFCLLTENWDDPYGMKTATTGVNFEMRIATDEDCRPNAGILKEVGFGGCVEIISSCWSDSPHDRWRIADVAKFFEKKETE